MINKSLRINKPDIMEYRHPKLVPYVFSGKERMVYENANLSIYIDKYCNADCKFCVDHLKHEKNSLRKLDDDKVYFDKLIKILEFLKPLNLSVSVTGGEPTESSRIRKVASLLKEFNIRKKVLTSNGARLLEEEDGVPLINHLINCEFNHLNISRAHFDETINQNIMNFNKNYFSIEGLKKVISICKDTMLRIRMSAVLTKETINSFEHMINYLDKALELAIDNVIFRELMEYDNNTVQISNISKYINEYRYPLKFVYDQMDEDKRFEFVTQVLGYYYYVEVFKYKNKIDVCTESSNLADIKKYRTKEEKEYGSSFVHELVFHPNGTLNASWRQWEDILIS